MKNILITGGAGFIGSNLAIRLVKSGYQVTVLDNLSPQIHGDNPTSFSPLFCSIKSLVNFVYGSVTCRQDWEKCISNQHVIIHLAAETGTGQSMYCIDKYTSVNVQGTALMLDILANSTHSVEKIILASSRSIYGEGKYFHPLFGYHYPSQRSLEDMLKGEFNFKTPDGDYYVPLATDEDSKIHPHSVYGITKQAQEAMVMTVAKSIGIAPVALRFQNVYGPGQSLSNPYTGILSIFSTRIRNGNEIQIFEDGLESRDFVYIDDIVDSIILCIQSVKADFNVFNVGTGLPTSVLDVANCLISAYSSNVPIVVTGKFRVGDIRHNFADLKKIHSTLGFNPKTTFLEGIKKFSAWVLSQEIKLDLLDNSFVEMQDRGLLK